MGRVKNRQPKLEITSYLDNAYDFTNVFGCFKSSILYAILYSFQVSLLSDTKWQS